MDDYAYVHFLVLALLAPVLLLCGTAAQILRLPLITGYVLGGIVVGPYCLGILNVDALQALAVVDHACLAIIAFSAGAELQIGDVRRIKKQVTCITLGVCIATWLSVFGLLMAIAPSLPMTASLPTSQSAAVVSLAATLMMARSPASMIAVLKETGGRGPYSSLVMAVVIVKDVVVFICFAVNIEMSDVVMRKSGEGFGISILFEPVASLAVSTVLGLMFGILIGRLLGVPARPFNVLLRRLPPAAQTRAKAVMRTAAIALLAMSIFWTALQLHAEPLLACVLAGIITTNRKGEAASKGIHEDLGTALTHLMPLVNMAFFSLAGASLLLGRVVATLWVAVGVYTVRLLAIYLGSWVGAWMGETPTEHRRKVWQGMITQAGVAMGLAKAVAARFPSWGPDFVFLMMSVIMMNLFTGPSMFRSAVISTGEARALQLPSVSNDTSFPSPKKLADGLADDDGRHKHEDLRHKHSPSALLGRSESL
ncbi:hypothetical protein COCOBI_07-4310 [Coccomyxa sp. Obi]|nr:hypothetical protein COCOBI_07-4310 [Coccomyxa sp. Obi]